LARSSYSSSTIRVASALRPTLLAGKGHGRQARSGLRPFDLGCHGLQIRLLAHASQDRGPGMPTGILKRQLSHYAARGTRRRRPSSTVGVRRCPSTTSLAKG
jgi:hypothetical protein